MKLFVIAAPEERARRRHAELTAKGDLRSLEEVAEDLRIRDERDMGRADAPLRPAEDACLLDTTEKTIDAAVAEAARRISEQLPEA